MAVQIRPTSLPEPASVCTAICILVLSYFLNAYLVTCLYVYYVCGCACVRARVRVRVRVCVRACTCMYMPMCVGPTQ